LADASKFEEFRKHQANGSSDPLIRVFLKQPILTLDEPDGHIRVQVTAPGLLNTRLAGSLPKQIQLILIQTALHSEKKSIITETWRVYSFLVNEQSIDHSAHLDQMLPFAAVAGKTRYLPRANRTDLTETDLRDHSFKTRTNNGATGRATEILVYDLDVIPAQESQMTLHAILQALTFQVVHHLVR
jgi:hypothetical protein